MTVYHYVKLAWEKGDEYGGGIWVTSTFSDLLDWIKDQVKKLDLVDTAGKDRLPSIEPPGESFRMYLGT